MIIQLCNATLQYLAHVPEGDYRDDNAFAWLQLDVLLHCYEFNYHLDNATKTPAQPLHHQHTDSSASVSSSSSSSSELDTAIASIMQPSLLSPSLSSPSSSSSSSDAASASQLPREVIDYFADTDDRTGSGADGDGDATLMPTAASKPLRPRARRAVGLLAAYYDALSRWR
jgi:hypothetical protein